MLGTFSLRHVPKKCGRAAEGEEERGQAREGQDVTPRARHLFIRG